MEAVKADFTEAKNKIEVTRDQNTKYNGKEECREVEKQKPNTTGEQEIFLFHSKIG